MRGTLPVTQSEWGIKPYRGMMGALKVRDTIEVVIDVTVPRTKPRSCFARRTEAPEASGETPANRPTQ